jgi:quercetin dioxygenase-like cupin family protein
MKKETIKSAQTTIDFLLEAGDTNGAATMFEFTVPTGARVPVTYYHEHLNETIYGVERIITFTVEAKAIDIVQGETSLIPRAFFNV